MSKKIKVVDSYMGSGKTSWAIAEMNENWNKKKYIFITPFLEETARIEDACPKLDFHRPDARKGRGRKMVHLLELIQQGVNISSTHALFANISDHILEALKASNYTLILDEVASVLEGFDLWKNDFSTAGIEYKAELTRQNIKTLQTKGFIEVSENFQVTWIDGENQLDKYSQMKQLADRGLLYVIRDSLLLWSFPTEVFVEGIFEDVYVLTYQFQYQLQYFYYQFFGIEFDEYHIEKIDGKYEMITSADDQYDLDFRSRIKDMIIIVENEKLNKIGNPYTDSARRMRTTTLSKSWYGKFSETMMPFLQDNMSNFFQNISGSIAGDRMWTSFVADKESFRGKNINPKHHVSLNSRATNQYGTKSSLAYMVNRFLNPMYQAFFQTRGVEINGDGFALSEMLQWVFRSAIRNGDAIHLYIPSYRMRMLLKAWLDNEPLEGCY